MNPTGRSRFLLLAILCTSPSAASAAGPGIGPDFSGELQAVERSAREEKLAALERLEADGRFSVEAVREVLAFTESSPDPMLRARGARTFYLLFYDLRGQEDQAFGFLIEPGMAARMGRLSRDKDPEVRRNILQTAQIMASGMDAGKRDRLAREYLAGLVGALDDPLPELRHEALAAMENLRDTPVFTERPTRDALERKMKAEQETDVRERIADLLR